VVLLLLARGVDWDSRRLKDNRCGQMLWDVTSSLLKVPVPVRDSGGSGMPLPLENLVPFTWAAVYLDPHSTTLPIPPLATQPVQCYLQLLALAHLSRHCPQKRSDMAGPLSVEDILAKQKAEKEAAAKVSHPPPVTCSSLVAHFSQPKFLTKAERQRLALEKRNAEVKEQQEKDEVEKQSRVEFERAAEEERRRAAASRYGTGGGSSGRCEWLGLARARAERCLRWIRELMCLDDQYDRDGYGRQDGYGARGGGYGRGGYGRQDYRDDRRDFRGGDRGGPDQGGRNGPASSGGVPTGPRGQGTPSGPRSMQNGSGHGNGYGNGYGSPAHISSPLAGSSAPGGSPKPNQPGDVALPSDTELSTIRARYLGGKVDNKKPYLRKATDKRAIFDWKPEEDTTASEQGTWRSEVMGAAPTAFGGRLAGYDEARRNQEAAPDK
jgi:ATP-dependent RNA helicase DDX23/PRP28